MSKGQPDQVRNFFRQTQYPQDPSQQIMQAPAPRMYPIPNSNHMQIRGAYQGGNRVQYVPMQQQELVQQNNAYYQQPGMYANHNYPQQYNVYQSPQGGYHQPRQPIMFIQPGTSPNYVQQSVPQNLQTIQQQQAPRQVYLSNHQIHQHQSMQQQPPQKAHQPTETTPKKRTTIKITDPNSGKDLTSEILKKEKTPVRPINPVKISVPETTTPVKPVETDMKSTDAAAKANAAFAAKVLALQKDKEAKTETPEVSKNTEKETIKEPQKPVLKKPDEPVDQVDKELSKETEKLRIEGSSSDPITSKLNEITQEKTDVELTKADTTITEEVKPKEEESAKSPEPEPEVEATTETKSDEIDTMTASTTPLVNGHIEVKPTLLVAKKKKKNKNFDSKDGGDMLSAFTDPPKKEDPPIEPIPPPKVVSDPTWEDKEKTIEKEIIRNEDAEEPESIQPRTEQVTIVNSEEADEDGKLHTYDRDFLLKFQFAPICTSKPANLPNIDIVLETAHQPTKPLDPDQKFASNNFMPTFMRQPSGGGRSAGGGNRSSKGGRAPGSMGGKPQKVIQLQHFEKPELKRAENAWVRPSDQEKELPEDEKAMKELERNVRSILNKLTPQKFKTLVGTMTSLKIDSVVKLEKANELIFEKAISEPGFSVAYANMCRVLTDAFKSMPGENTNFRKILLNKCQKEFEKEKLDDLQMEKDRSKTFENEKERKEWLIELDYRELKNRRRTLGNIRFIGELFKLKMISEKIMHECIFKLLRNNKPESMEDHLECLCKLLTTIGKDLDHAEAKPRMDQYFEQIKKIIEKKKISSRIKFALKDVIDLRHSNWIPRRDEGNPKTIDQINKEAAQKAKEEEMYRQQEKIKPREPRGRNPAQGAGGRDSPSVRPPNSDGWTNVSSSKARGFAPTPVDASKFKLNKKSDSGDISLGPGGRPGAWSKGASGGSSSRTGSGSNTPTNEIETKGNRFDLLAGSSELPSSQDSRRGGSRSNSGVRKTSQGGSNRRDERSAALRAVRDLTGTGSRTQSPVRSGDSSRNSPVSGSQTPVESSRSPNPTTPALDEDKMRKKTKSIIEEFFGVLDHKEAVLCIKELESQSMHYVFVEEVVVIATEKKLENRLAAGNLFCHLMKENVLKYSELEEGLKSLVEIAPDMAVDIPRFYQYLGEILSPMIADPSVLSLTNLKILLEPLVNMGKAGVIMAEALNMAASKTSTEEEICKLWNESGLSWDALIDKYTDVKEFIQDKKLEYLATAPKSHASQIQEQLLQLLKAKSDEKTIIDVIDKEVSPEERKTPEFIHSLTNVICTTSINEEGKECTCNKELLNNRKRILLKYIDSDKRLELQAAFALQNLVADLNHPRGLLTTFFEEFYDADIISEETIDSWETSKEFPDGKGVALSEVKDFLHWLKKAEEETNEEETTTTK